MGNKKYKQKHKEMGLCRNCSNPSHEGFTLCLKHLRLHNKRNKRFRENNKEYDAKRQKEYREKRREDGACISCGGVRDSESNYCINCRENIHIRRVEHAATIV